MYSKREWCANAEQSWILVLYDYYSPSSATPSNIKIHLELNITGGSGGQGRHEDSKTSLLDWGQVRRKIIPHSPISPVSKPYTNSFTISIHLWQTLPLYLHSNPILPSLCPVAAPLVISSPLYCLPSSWFTPKTNSGGPGRLWMSVRSRHAQHTCLCWVSRAGGRALQSSVFSLPFRPAQPEPVWTSLPHQWKWPFRPSYPMFLILVSLSTYNPWLKPFA